jgi:hypothetical protein
LNFLKYRNAQEFLNDTGFTVEQGLVVVEKEIENLKETKSESGD